MESSLPKRSARNRNKSETNQNGEDAEEKSQDNIKSEAMEAEETIESEERPTQGRKRKASEMKDDESQESGNKGKANAKDSKKDKDSEDSNSMEHAEDSSSSELAEVNDDMSLPGVQTLGKGKRARIPNKRYSDISLTPQAKAETPKKVAENGDSIIKETEILEKTPKPEKKDTPFVVKKQKFTGDVNNPAYLKPFEFGWKRELVYRGTSDLNTSKRQGDIYYYTPGGKKVRSMREVAENLKNKELTLENFTFFKEPIGLDSEQEIIRDAKYKSGPAATTAAVKKPDTVKTVKTPKQLKPKTSPADSTTPNSSPSTSPKAKSAFKVKLPSKTEKTPKAKGGPKKLKEDDMDVSTPPLSPKKTGKRNNDHKPCRPCSIRCPDVSGPIPTLQCLQCLCLYHHECVGLSPQAPIQGYFCKNCHLEQDPAQQTSAIVKEPSLGKVQPMPMLQPMPLPTKNNLVDFAKVMPRLTPKPGIETAEQVEGPNDNEINKGLVGSVTTWFPPSSTIQVGPEKGALALAKPQFVEIIGDRKYLVVPTQNVVAVSPTVAPITQPFPVPMIETGSNLPVEEKTPSLPEESSSPQNLIETETVTAFEPILPSPVPTLSAIAAQMALEDHLPAGPYDLETESPEKKRSQRISTLKKAEEPVKLEEPPSTFMQSYMQNLSYGYSALLYVFQYLKVQDLLQAGCVCTMWRDMANNPNLWATVRMKNSQVHCFKGLAKTLKKHGTVHLDLRKMLLPSAGDDIWPTFSDSIKDVQSLLKIELCRCPATVIEKLAETNPHLEVLTAVTLNSDTMSLNSMKHLTNLQELRLKSINGLSLSSDLTALKELKELKRLSLTSVRDLHKLNLNVIADLVKLETLDLGECTDFPEKFGSEILSKLVHLEKLRLEKGQGNCDTLEILEAIQKMKELSQLELVNFDIKPGFDKALGSCHNLKKLLIIPTYISQSATTNHMVLGGVLKLHKSLSHFVWGVTLELLRVTELFVDQCEDPEKKDKKEKKPAGTGDSIPVLKPVPVIGADSELAIAQDPPQVEILPLPNLQKLLLQNLPRTRVKILKIPFHATWRQTITDTVN